MAGAAETGGARYRAFISYSHKDAAFGRRLHRRLEAFAMPLRLVGRPTRRGPVPARLTPIFRDREELPAAHDLSAEVRAALQASDSLVVVCSPAAAASPWVAREVELFRALHPDRPVLAALIEGEPAEAFPAPLRRDGSGQAALIEPLAADFRAGRDGPRLALLKLVAGIVGVGLDQLVQRDAQRRLRRVTAVTVVALAAMLAMGVLTVFALSARSEAERQRREAEGMVEFMLTDLRDRLKGVGRLDVLTAVNQRALRYYGDQDLSRLPADSLERRARVLHAMGDDDETRGDDDAALAKFREARRTTAALLAEAPDDPERIYTHAQSEFWIGYVDFQRGRSAAALPAFRSYKRLADRLVTIEPGNPTYLKEAGYAEGNLCSVAMEKPSDPREALRACSAALAQMERAARRLGPGSGIEPKLVNRHALLANAYQVNGDLKQARAQRLIEERMLSRLMAADPRNMALIQSWVALQRALADLDLRDGQPAACRHRLAGALSQIGRMTTLDPSNRDWADQKRRISQDIRCLGSHRIGDKNA